MTEPDLFVGVPINPKIQQSLDAASLPFRRYFEGGKFLTIVEDDRARWLGKPITRNASPDRVDDMKRHVRSVILKIDDGTPIALDDISVIDMPPEPPPPPPPPVEEPAEEAAAEDAPAGETAAETAPAGDAPAGDAPAAKAPAEGSSAEPAQKQGS
ncbi:MAG: hypothetical protein QGH45_17725 [Myxococcota bacterium]|jgi:hypothetical protein|nr:hypothetical protein [Myxococcota bacterium]